MTPEEKELKESFGKSLDLLDDIIKQGVDDLEKSRKRSLLASRIILTILPPSMLLVSYSRTINSSWDYFDIFWFSFIIFICVLSYKDWRKYRKGGWRYIKYLPESDK